MHESVNFHPPVLSRKKLYSFLRKRNAKQREKETIGRNILKKI